MKMTVIVSAFSALFLCGGVVFAEEAAVKESVKTETQFAIPKQLEEMRKKELEKLPAPERHLRMAQDYSARGQFDDAIREIDMVLKEDPKNLPANCELGVVYMGKNDYAKAIEQLNKTLSIDPKYPKTHYALANAYARQPNPDVKMARQHLDEAIGVGYHPVQWFVDYLQNLENKLVHETK